MDFHNPASPRRGDFAPARRRVGGSIRPAMGHFFPELTKKADVHLDVFTIRLYSIAPVASRNTLAARLITGSSAYTDAI